MPWSLKTFHTVFMNEKKRMDCAIETFLEEINTVLDTMLQEHSINDDSDLWRLGP